MVVSNEALSAGVTGACSAHPRPDERAELLGVALGILAILAGLELAIGKLAHGAMVLEEVQATVVLQGLEHLRFARTVAESGPCACAGELASSYTSNGSP
jgi:hypothetical protein